MDLSLTVESRVLRCRCAPKPALAAASRRPETAAAAPTPAGEREPLLDVLTGFKEEDADPAWMALKRKTEEGFQHPNKKAKTEDASSSEEYWAKWPDFEWEHPGYGPKVTYELNFLRVRIFMECTKDSDEEICRPLTRRHPPNTEIEAMVEDFRVAIKRWVYFYK